MAAQQAYYDAAQGRTVDNLVLIGAPINPDLQTALESSPNIKRIIYVNIVGDPVTPGQSDLSYMSELPKLFSQQQSNTGHFYFVPSGPVGTQHRQDLAKTLHGLGVK